MIFFFFFFFFVFYAIQDPSSYTSIDDAFSSVLQYMSTTTRQCKVVYQFSCQIKLINYSGLELKLIKRPGGRPHSLETSLMSVPGYGLFNFATFKLIRYKVVI